MFALPLPDASMKIRTAMHSGSLKPSRHTAW
jgi:hypothetical protein